MEIAIVEKFGIFELLDALSAVTENAPPPAKDGQNAAPPAQKVPDAAFDAPDYGTERTMPPPAGGTAYDGFLAKHDAVKKRTAKKSR